MTAPTLPAPPPNEVVDISELHELERALREYEGALIRRINLGDRRDGLCSVEEKVKVEADLAMKRVEFLQAVTMFPLNQVIKAFGAKK